MSKDKAQEQASGNGSQVPILEQIEALRPTLTRATPQERAAFARERRYAGKRRLNEIADRLEQRALEMSRDPKSDNFRLSQMVGMCLKIRQYKADQRAAKDRRTAAAKSKLEEIQANAKGSLTAETLADIEEATRLL